jgi:hypothetical protein
MSLLWLFRRFFDVVEFNEQQAELRRKHEVQPPDVNPDEIYYIPQAPRAAEPQRFACRLCGYESMDGSYCPKCIAITMEPY